MKVMLLYFKLYVSYRNIIELRTMEVAEIAFWENSIVHPYRKWMIEKQLFLWMMKIASCSTCSLFYSLTQAWSAVNPLHWKECEWGRPTPMAWNLRALPRALRILNSIHSYSFSPNETVQDRLQTKNPRASKQWPFNGFGRISFKCCPSTLFSNMPLVSQYGDLAEIKLDYSVNIEVIWQK